MTTTIRYFCGPLDGQIISGNLPATGYRQWLLIEGKELPAEQIVIPVAQTIEEARKAFFKRYGRPSSHRGKFSA